MTTIANGALVPTAAINQWCPPGAVCPYAGTVASVPAGWLLCDGASYLRSDYPDLFAAIGTTYGAADGTHFNVPDLRGRAIAGHAASGGHADVSTIGNNDGVAVANRRPKHRHTAHTHTVSVGGTWTVPFDSTLGPGGGVGRVALGNGASAGAITITNASVDGGSGNASDSLDAPAYLVMPYIIRAKDV